MELLYVFTSDGAECQILFELYISPLVGVNFSFPSGVFVSFFAGTFQGIFSKEIKSFKITTFPVQSNSSF